MELIAQFIDVLIHLDRYLGVFVQDYGAWIYLLLFLIVFAETGLVVTPFLPGDSLLFVAGTLAAAGGMDVVWLCAILITAAILGDTVNYWIGDWFGPKLFHDENARFLKRNTSTAPTGSTNATAARPSSSRASCPSSVPSRRSSPASARCPTANS